MPDPTRLDEDLPRSDADIAAQADRLLDHADRGAALPADRLHPLDWDKALRVQRRIVALRIARGERRRGYKIGFTNRSLWPLYGVDHPIWAPVWDTSVIDIDAGVDATGRASAPVAVSIARLAEPRLEPEIILGLRARPRDDSLSALQQAIDWYAHGFEIVHSIYPGWRFTAAQAQAAQALHGRLLIGPRHPFEALDDPLTHLSSLALTLCLDQRPVAQGRGTAVLDGPLQALLHLSRQLLAQGESLQAGDVVTTGTLTDAQPLTAGQQWSSRFDDLTLPGLSIRVID